MLHNYLKIALRNLLKKKAYSFINIVGLSVGIACCIVILLFVIDEFLYDTFHEHSDRIYRVHRTHTGSGGARIEHAEVNYALTPILRQNFPQIESVAQLANIEEKVSADETVFMEPRFFYANPSVLDVFTISLLKGDAKTALSEPMSVVLTKKTAQKYFGNVNPVGKTITVDDEHLLTVTGVARELPENSHFHFDFLASLESTRNMFSDAQFDQWGNLWVHTYLLIQNEANIGELEQQLNPIIANFSPPAVKQFKVAFSLFPLTDIHLYSRTPSELEAGGNALFVYVFLAVAVLVLAIACFNFINLGTARSSWRAREVGMRKVFGAHRGNLVRQFMGESLLVSFIGVVLAVILVEAALPFLNAFLGRSLELNLFSDMTILVSILLILLVVGLLAGSYPAFVLSSFTPVKVLKGKSTLGKQDGGKTLRNGLVIFQFTISIILIIGTIIVYSQLQYIKNKDLGFDKEQIVVVKINNREAGRKMDLIKQQFAAHANVLSISGVSDVIPKELNSWQVHVAEQPEDSYELLKVLAVDNHFFELLDIPIISGRNFSEERGDLRSRAVILNEKAVSHFGFPDPVNNNLIFDNLEEPSPVVGVAQDFHFNTLHTDISPVAFVYFPEWLDNLYIKIGTQDISATLSALEQEWTVITPGWPFEYQFLDETFERQYQAEEKLGQLISFFSVLAIFVACLGLFGLASFTTEQRFKEIGIRKVLGASISSILALLSTRYLYLVAFSFLIAIPVSYFAMNQWLQSFSYRISIGPTVFLLAGILAAFIALGTVSWQSVKAARMNPIDSLRSE